MNPVIRRAMVEGVLSMVDEKRAELKPEIVKMFWSSLVRGGIPQHMVGQVLKTFFGRRS